MIDKKTFLTLAGTVLMLLSTTGCADSTDEKTTQPNVAEQAESDDSKASEGKTYSEFEEDQEEPEESKDILAKYSNDEIEYARIWLQLGPNQEISELYVQRFPAGTLVNPNDENSAVYPDDVVQLSGSRLVDGSVTYSSNGNGTINVYKVPYRWETTMSEVEVVDGVSVYTQDLLDEAEVVSVDVGEDASVVELIELERMTENN
ncbi:hypothetical protein [Marinilactibacillus sp. Marseille-P9653]|uniref:hypothetical protein n=1 Tax=Marinilactibacillus sp. Marseille-P9653 TaxID=2866583 RepID=UPI001CE4AAD2|nr:hypothetical protein [Marinilactibacillus sp. Marseille-P9653]